MTKGYFTKLTLSLILLGLIFTIRLVWFLNTSKLSQNLWMSLGFILSLGILIFLFFPIKTHILKHKPQLIYVSTLFILEWLFVLKNGLTISYVYLFSVLFSVILLYVLSIWLHFKLRRIIDITIIIFFAIYFIGQDIYYRIFDDLFSFKEAVTIREGLESAQGMYQFDVLHVFVILGVALSIYYYLKFSQSSNKKFLKCHVRKAFLLPLSLLILIQFNMHYRVSAYQVYTSDHYLYTSVFHKTTFVSRFGMTQLILRDSLDALTPTFYTQKDIEFIDERIKSHAGMHDENRFTGLFEGKNLIFIVAESFDEIALSQELTPNLYRLKHEGLDFQNHYTPVFQRTTSDTEFIFNTSLIPSIEDGPTSYMYHDNSYSTSLANLFNKKGYDTRALHGNYASFYARDLTYVGFGYQAFYGQHELSIPEDKKMLDTEFYDYAQDIIVPLTGTFMRFIITFSGHSPYDITHPAVQKHIDTVNQHYAQDISHAIANYIATQIELEMMLTKLLDDLSSKGRLSDTVIVLSGDHYPYTLNQLDYLDYKNIEDSYLKHQGNLYIWSHDIQSEEIQMLSSSFDILPILNNMFGLDGNYAHYVGKDIFGTTSQLVYFKNYAFFDGTSYVLLSNRFTQIEPLKLKQAYEDYLYSRNVMRTNYFEVAN